MNMTPPADLSRMRVTADTVYRVQDAHGRGPWKPGFSAKWVEEREDHDNLIPWLLEFGPVHEQAIAGMAVGTACRTLEQLRRWFTKSEYENLRRRGYMAVSMDAGRILAESEIQLVFERCRALNVGTVPVNLYP